MDNALRKTRIPVGGHLSRALARSTGFVVESPHGPLGTVEAVRFSGQPRRPLVLVVRIGGSKRTTIGLVPPSSVESVDPESRRVVLRSGILLRRGSVRSDPGDGERETRRGREATGPGGRSPHSRHENRAAGRARPSRSPNG
jgi:hypothetical protein